MDDGLPDAGVATKEIILILHHANKMSFWVEKGGGRERKYNRLLLLRITPHVSRLDVKNELADQRPGVSTNQISRFDNDARQALFARYCLV